MSDYGSGPSVTRPYKDDPIPLCEHSHILKHANGGIDDTSYTNKEQDWFIDGPTKGQIHCTEEEIKHFIKVSGVLGSCPDEIIDSKRTVCFKVHSKETRDSMYITNGIPEVKSQAVYRLPRVSGDLETSLFGGINWDAKWKYDHKTNKTLKERIKAGFLCYD